MSREQDLKMIEEIKENITMDRWRGIESEGLLLANERERAALREIERLRSVLMFYGVVENYFRTEEKTAFGTYTHYPAVRVDGGKRAREVLGE